ncbi:MAG: hypothetical protein ACI9X4_002255 [Glaciecola sp.]|jgi:hypothetical protein
MKYQALLLSLSLGLSTLSFGMPQRAPHSRANVPVPDFGLTEGHTADQSSRAANLDLSTGVDHSRLYWDQASDESILVRGQDYKAQFDTQGFHFVPFLGSKVPRNFPLSLSMQDVRIGSETLPWTDSVEPRRDGETVVWDRGLFTEKVRVGLQQMEQTFLFEDLPNQGSLSLRIGVQTDLLAAKDGSGLLFSNEHGGVRYSGAVAFDEAGARIEIPSRWTGSAIEIVVPESFLSRAKGAILVDPFLSTFTIDSAPGADLTNPTLAYDVQADHYLAVIREQFSAGDHDLYSWFLAGSTGTRSGGNYLWSGPEDSGVPSVAYHQQSRSFMTVVSETDLAPFHTSILGRTRNSVSGSIGASFSLDGGMQGLGTYSPVIGGDHWTSGASYFCVAWTRVTFAGVEVVCQLLNSDGTSAGFVQDLQVDTNVSDSKLRISKSTGDTGFTSYWQVVWQEELASNGNVLLNTQRIRFDGAFAGSRRTLRTNPGGPYFSHVSVSDLLNYGSNATQSYALVTFGYGSNSTSSLWSSLVHQNGNASAIQLYNQLNYDTLLHIDCVVATTNEHWIITWAQGYGHIFSVVAQPVGNSLGFSEGRFLVADAGVTITDLAACSTASGGGPDVWSDAMIAWTQGLGDRTIQGARVFATREQTAGIQYCRGLRNSSGEGAYMTAIGNRLPSSTQELRTDNMPINVFGYYLVGTETDYVPFAGGSKGNFCLGGIGGRYNQTPEIRFSGASGSFALTIDPLAIPQGASTISATSGQTYYFQTWYRDTVSGTPASNFSTALSIPFQ